ncbi:L-serine/homoserine O-acetyltransferase [bacterium BMS3Bbin12]|nr:L-serine/homoserine O-acetyltransferase [bacterium BMS3Abin12]GBE48314.1 L-serine/homoserine O-acetyltransferase [bacterium BMS3Bbin12]GBE51202.1 L-serine/homoserine O-acetyltransferase [bacterium BMS3Bbin13]HDK02636.1 homoserine O-acetyltransferase [Gammaproteobacteria bacterium]
MSSAGNVIPLREAAPGGTVTIRLPGPFEMWHGGILPEVRLACETWGKLNAARDNAVLLFPGLSPGPHAASSAENPTPGWWEYMIGPGRPIDTRHYFAVCVNSLGGCFGTTGPASIDPHTREPYRLNFPELAVEDIAASAHGAVEALGIERLHAVVGASLGGMAALAYAMQFPDGLDDLVAISSATRATPFTIALRSLQREIIRNDPEWRSGFYAPGKGPREGMRLARKLGLVSYRSAVEWQQRFARERVKTAAEEQTPFGIEFEIEAYLEHNAQKFVDCFDANAYLYLSRAMDRFDAAEHGGTVEAGLARIQARRTLVIGVETDFLFPMQQQEEIAASLYSLGRNVTFVPLASIHGHDAFLIDRERFAPVMARFFAEA